MGGGIRLGIKVKGNYKFGVVGQNVTLYTVKVNFFYIYHRSPHQDHSDRGQCEVRERWV